MLFNKAFKLRDFDTNAPRKTPDGGDLMAMVTTSEMEKGPSELPRSFWMVASNQTIDRDGDVIMVKGWDLKNYKKNPVGLWMHQYTLPPIFRAADMEKTDTQLRILMHFPEELGQLSDEIYNAYQAKVLRASSVGFGVQEVSEDAKLRESVGLPPESGYGKGTLFIKQELWENSAVTVPSNPTALAQIKSAGLKTEKLEEMLQHQEDFVIEIKEPEQDPPAEPDTPDEPDPQAGIEQAMVLLEEAGYTVTQAEEETPPEIAIEFDVTEPVIDIEIEPEPTVEITPEIAASINDGLKKLTEKRIRKIVTDRIDYLSGRIMEE